MWCFAIFSASTVSNGSLPVSDANASRRIGERIERAARQADARRLAADSVGDDASISSSVTSSPPRI